MDSLIKPQPGRPVQVRIFFDARQNNQYFLAHDATSLLRAKLSLFLMGLLIWPSKILKEEKATERIPTPSPSLFLTVQAIP